MKRIISIISIIALTGCSGAVKLHQGAQETADFTLQAGIVGYCDAPTMGALSREYSGDISKLIAHANHCGWTGEPDTVLK